MRVALFGRITPCDRAKGSVVKPEVAWDWTFRSTHVIPVGQAGVNGLPLLAIHASLRNLPQVGRLNSGSKRALLIESPPCH